MAPPATARRLPNDPRARRLGGDRGSALAELALVLPLLAVIAFGIADVARAHSLQNQLTNMAREGAFYAQYHPSDVSGCANGSITQSALTEDSTVTGATVTVIDSSTGLPVANSCGATPVPGSRIRVRVAAPLKLMTPLAAAIVGDPLNVSGSVEVVVQG